MIGKVLQAVSRYTGTSTVGVEAVGQTVISVDSVRDFVLDAGFVFMGDSVRAYSSVDRINSTITLTSTLTVEAPAGTDIKVYPLSTQRWALVEPASVDIPTDAVWAVIPHALAAFIDADGVRLEADQEVVECEKTAGREFIILDVKNKTPYLNADAIPDGLITETKISPGSITTPLLAANAVATQHLQFGAATGDVLSSDAINGKTITGPLIRSAASGPRVEFTTEGLKQYKVNGGVETVTMSIGDQNKFTGEIDATSMIIQDGLQLFGKNNFMSVGSKMTLAASAGAPAQPPTLAWTYDPGPVVDSTMYGVGGFSTPGALKADHTAHFYNTAEYERADGKRWTFPTITAPNGSSVPEFMPLSMMRIAKADNGAERVVMLGQNYNDYANGYPRVYVRVYDDSTMLADGTVTPILKGNFYWADFDWNKSYRVGRMVTGSNRNQFIIATITVPQGGGGKTLQFHQFNWNNNDSQADGAGSHNFGQILGSVEHLAGFTMGAKSSLGIPGTGSDLVFVGLTTSTNFVWNLTNNVYEPALQFPTTFNYQDHAWSEGVTSTNTHTAFVTQNSATGANIKTYRYANNLVSGTIDPVWATFIWRGEANTSYRTTMGTQSSIAYRKMAKLKITIPPLPAPIAGQGAARSPAADVYGWEYFLGIGAGAPPRTSMWLQTIQPAMVANTPLAVTSIDLGTYPLLSGTNPPATPTFPASTAASIENASGSLKVSGDGKVTADEFLGGAVDKLWDLLMPPGVVIISSDDVAPYRTLPCDGTTRSRTTYSVLFSKIGTTYGIGDGSTTFHLPNYNARSPIGAGSAGMGNNYALGQQWGHESMQTHTHTQNSHGHGVNDPGHSHGINMSYNAYAGGATGAAYFAAGDATHPDWPYITGRGTGISIQGATATNQNAGSGDKGNVHPVLAQTFWIRY